MAAILPFQAPNAHPDSGLSCLFLFQKNARSSRSTLLKKEVAQPGEVKYPGPHFVLSDFKGNIAGDANTFRSA